MGQCPIPTGTPSYSRTPDGLNRIPNITLVNFARTMSDAAVIRTERQQPQGGPILRAWGRSGSRAAHGIPNALPMDFHCWVTRGGSLVSRRGKTTTDRMTLRLPQSKDTFPAFPGHRQSQSSPVESLKRSVKTQAASAH